VEKSDKEQVDLEELLLALDDKDEDKDNKIKLDDKCQALE
jgi:hypothetical protein